ncbi:MAG: glycoside hydrolase family 18 protein, partial [Clostridia bacterium]
EYDREFVHSTYIASNDYVHQIGWGTHINKEYYDSLTDIIMIGSTLIDKDARFTVGIEDNGGNLRLAKLLDWDDPLVEKYMAADDLAAALPSELGKTVYAGEKGYIPFVKSISDNPVKPNIWMAMGVVTKAQSSDRGIAANALNAMSDPVKRAKFVSDAVSFCKKYEFYGIDIDWEYCGAGLLDTYNKFLIELGTALHAEGKHLSAAQFTGMSTQGGFASVEAIKHLDRVNMMSYDQKGTSGRGNHHSTFNGATVNDIDKYLAHGYPIEKLCLGTAWYGGNEGYNAFFSKLQAEAEATNPGVTNPKVDLGKNFFGGTDGNGVYLIRSRTLYAIQRKMCGLFSFRGAIDINIDEKPENRYASIGIAEKETIEKFVTYKDGVQTKFGEIKDGKPIQK